MIYISHRGNLKGAEPELENNPEYIEKAILEGYDVMVDLRLKDGKLYLGSTEPQYELNIDWFEHYAHKLWIKCWDVKIFDFLYREDPVGINLRYLWHQHVPMDVCQVSNGFLWLNDTREDLKGENVIIALESKMGFISRERLADYAGFCSDFVAHYRDFEEKQ